jgi:hypothetical protein
MKRIAFVLALLAASVAHAQAPRTPSPLQTLSSQPAGTYNTADQANVQGFRGVVCAFNQSSSSGTPSTTFSIQEKDAAAATYTNLAVSTALTANGTALLEVYPGIQTSSLPTGFTAATSLVLPRLWRVQTIVAGSGGPGITATIECVPLP